MLERCQLHQSPAFHLHYARPEHLPMRAPAIVARLEAFHGWQVGVKSERHPTRDALAEVATTGGKHLRHVVAKDIVHLCRGEQR